MALAHEFEYFKPANLTEALALKAQFGAKARFLAGGTDIINNISEEMLAPEALIDIKGIADLDRLVLENGNLWIGALVTFSKLLSSPIVKEEFPLIWEASSEVASISVRNRATMAGNYCSCVPCLDSAPALMVYEAVAVLAGPGGVERRIPVAQFATGPRRTVIKDDEILLGFSVPQVKSKNGTSYVKLKRYQGEDLSQAGVAIMALEGNKYRIAFGSVGPVPIRSAKIENLLNGKSLDGKLLEAAKALVKDEISPISDIRASKEYRMHMCEIMLGRALVASVERLNGNGPELGTRLV